MGRRSMILTKREFQDRFERNALHMAFIGASNAGKTFRTRQLVKDKGLVSISVDDEIGKELGIQGVTNLSRWMGQPHETRFVNNQATYLQLEESLTRQAGPPEFGNFILDTTGSAIYLSPSLKTWLSQTFLVVYARVSKAQESAWLHIFLESPKPLVWGDLDRPRSGESRQDTLSRCGSELLAWRHQRYRELSDISFCDFNSPSVSGPEFWDILLDELARTSHEDSSY